VEKMNYFVYIKDILGIKTTLDSFKWTYGSVAPKASKSGFDQCKIKIDLSVRKTNDVFDKSFDIEKLDRYNYFYAQKNNNKIYYERNLLFNSKLRYSIEVLNNNINIVINKNYYKFVKYKFMNLHSLGYILSDIVSGILLLNGYATLHCSSIKIGEKTMVIFAPPGTGKTITSINLCEDKEAKFISEDIAITDGDNIYSAPWTSTFRFYNHDKESKIDKLIDFINKKIPLFQLIRVEREKSIQSYMENISFLNFSKITDIIILGKGETNIVKTKEDLFEHIINLNKYEFNYHRSPSMLVINYFNIEISVDEMYRIEKEIIKKMIDNSNSYRILAKNAFEYSEIIKSNLICRAN
jgi:hypothetical protein